MQLELRSVWKQRLVTALMIVASIVAIGWLQYPQLQNLRAKSQTASVEEIRQDVAAEEVRLAFLQKMPTFGFDNVIADWAFLNFLQYFGDQPARQKTDYKLSPDFFEVVLGRDPYFMKAYTFLSTSASIYAGLPDRSIDLMKQGVESLKPDVPPDSYTVWRQIGVDQLLFQGDAAAARTSFLKAAEWAAQSSQPGSQNAAQISQQTADFLASNPNSKTAQVSAWVMVLTNAPDDRTRQTAVQRIEALGGKLVKQPDGSFSIQLPPKD